LKVNPQEYIVDVSFPSLWFVELRVF
jgi:hypothetical protein